jgi:hypothetical protein
MAIASATGQIRCGEHDLPSVLTNRGNYRGRVSYFDQLALGW